VRSRSILPYELGSHDVPFGGTQSMGKLINGTLTEQIIGEAIEVHRHWGPGLYERPRLRVAWGCS